MLIRYCDALDRLLEYNLLIKVMANNPPDFVSKLTTEFRLKVGERHTYTLPDVKDWEENDESVIYIGFEEGQKDLFPIFTKFYNKTNTLVLHPQSKTFAGRTF